MHQINFRLSDEEYENIKILAQLTHNSIPNLVKELTPSELKNRSPLLALELYKTNRIGYKQAWKLSLLSFHEFLDFLHSHNIDPHIPDDLDDKMVSLVYGLSLSELFSEQALSSLKKNFPLG